MNEEIKNDTFLEEKENYREIVKTEEEERQERIQASLKKDLDMEKPIEELSSQEIQDILIKYQTMFLKHTVNNQTHIMNMKIELEEAKREAEVYWGMFQQLLQPFHDQVMEQGLNEEDYLKKLSAALIKQGVDNNLLHSLDLEGYDTIGFHRILSFEQTGAPIISEVRNEDYLNKRTIPLTNELILHLFNYEGLNHDKPLGSKETIREWNNKFKSIIINQLNQQGFETIEVFTGTDNVTRKNVSRVLLVHRTKLNENMIVYSMLTLTFEIVKNKLLLRGSSRSFELNSLEIRKIYDAFKVRKLIE